MVLPATAILIAAGIGAASKGASDYFGSKGAAKQAKRRAKESKRETYAQMLNDAFNRSAEREAQRMSSGEKLGKARTRTFANSADLIRGAFNI